MTRFRAAPTPHRSHTSRRRVAAVIVATLLLAALPGTAAAAAPANDLPTGAIAITTIPASISIDTAEATVTPADDVGCGAGGVDQATVWYTLTLSAATRVAIDASASSYGVGINVFAGSASADQLLDCSEGTLVVDADAGTTYYLMFADVDEGANGGQLSVSVDVAPPAIGVSATVDDTAKVNPRTGEALVGGTITCTAETSDAFVEVELRQAIGRFTIHGFGGTSTECGPTPTQWWVTVTGENGKFGAGKATASGFAVACDPFSCSEASIAASLRLRR